MIMVI